MNKFSKNAYFLLSCLAINAITNIFIYTYLLAFIINVSSNNVTNVAIFYLALHISMIAFSWIMAPFFKKFKKTLALKMGFISKFLFVGMIVLFQNSILKLVYLIAFFNAFAEIMFWGGVNPLQAEIGKESNLGLFMSFSKVITVITNFVIPVIMGYFIDKNGLSIIAIAMLVCVVIQTTLSMFIKEDKPVSNIKLKYKEFLQDAKTSDVKIKPIYFNQLLFGICSNMSTLILYYTVITFGSNLSIGIFSSISTIFSVIILALYNWKKDVFSNIKTFITYGIFVTIAIISIILNLNKITLIIFYVVWNISIIVPEILTSTQRLTIIKNKSLENYNIENITISETYLNIGRITGEVIILLMAIINNAVFNIISLSVISVIVFIYFVHTSLINKSKIEDAIN